MSEIAHPESYDYRRTFKKNFPIGQRVEFHSTTDPELDGHGGEVLGRTYQDIFDCYIVLLDKPHSRGDRAVNIPEQCLDFETLTLRATRVCETSAQESEAKPSLPQPAS